MRAGPILVPMHVSPVRKWDVVTVWGTQGAASIELAGTRAIVLLVIAPGLVASGKGAARDRGTRRCALRRHLPVRIGAADVGKRTALFLIFPGRAAVVALVNRSDAMRPPCRGRTLAGRTTR
jgi:hypothetical protein